MGASNSKTTISAGAEHALADPELVSFVQGLTKGNIDAVQIANLVEKLPKNGTPVDESILQLYEQNVDSLVNDIKIATGIDSDLITGKNIRGMIATARKFGIQAIPYVVGIIATAATEGNVGAGIQAKNAADKAVNIAEKIENAIINVAATSKTPGFVKTLSDKLALGRKKLFSLLSGKKEFSGAYDELKKHYGPKFGACDCDKIGGKDEEDSIMSAVKYMKSSSSAAKTNLAKQIVESISKFISQTPPAELPDAEKANWLLAHMPGGQKNPRDMDENKMNAACDALVKILNSFVGKEVIAKDLDRVTKCAQAAEMLHSLTMGMHVEYLAAQQDIQTIEDNLNYIAQLEGTLNKEILEAMNPEMTEGQKLENLNKQEALKLLSEERERQMSMLRGITTGTFDKTDKNILELLKNGTILRADISDISDKNPSNKSFRLTLYKLLDMVVITGAVAAFIESALRGVGMTIDEYKKTQSLAQFKNKIAELTPKNSDYKVQEKFMKNADVLMKNFDRRADLATTRGARDEDSDSDDEIIGGADRKYPLTESEKKINARKNVRAVQLRIFANQLIRIYSGIERALDDIVPFVGESIPHDDDLDIFLERLLFLGDDQTLKGKTYEALAGAVVDPLATQIRMEMIGRFKMLVAIIEVLLNKSKDQGREKLSKLKSSIEDLIKLSDTSSDGFRKIIGGDEGDISASFAVDYGIGRSLIDLNKAIDKMRAFAKTAKVRENIRGIMTEYKGVNPDYEDMVGKNVGGMLNEINETQKKYLENVDEIAKIASPGDGQKMCENAREFYIGQFDSVKNVWRAAEAVDYYLGNFTHDLRLNASEIKDIASLLEGVTVHKNWYDAKLGNLLTGIYDNFPAGIGASGYVYPATELINNDGTQHYYELLSTFSPGSPIFSAEMFKHGPDALKKSKAFVSRFAILKNIVTLFYDLGSKYSGEKTKDSSKYMSPGSLLKALMDYMHYGSFNVVSFEQTKLIDDIKHAIGIVTPFDATGIEKLKKSMPGRYKTYSELSLKLFNLSLEDLVDKETINDNAQRELSYTMVNSRVADTNVAHQYPSIPHGSFELMLRSDNYDYLRGNHLLVKTDEMFCNLIKAMLAKILACIETFEIMKKPMLYNVNNSAVRQILGGADSEVKPEYTELYVRLILLIKFYKDIFSIDSTDGFTRYPKIDRSESKNLKISMMPDIDGVYGPLVQYMFSNDRLGVKNYTDSQMAVIVDKINEIIGKASGSGPEEKTQSVIKGFIKDINRRFALVTEEDLKQYKKLVDEERNLWGQLKASNADDYSAETIVMDQDEDISAFMRLPSDSYVTSGSLPKGIFGSNVVDYNVNKKYYGEYYKLYRSFRSKVDKYIHDNASENVPKLSGVIESVSKQLKLEGNMNRRLELLSKFLESGVDMTEVEKSKYVAFHEFIVSSINGISMIDAYITNIIACGYIVDKLGLGNAIIFNRGTAGVLTNGQINVNSVINAIDNMTLATGINSKAVRKILETFDLTSKGGTLAIANALNNLETDSGKLTAFENATYAPETLKEFIVNIFYGLSGNELFSVRIGETNINVDYAKLQEVIEKTYASVKSTLEKFRPYIDPKIYDLYVGQIDNNRNKNAIYELYDDLIRVKLNGAEVYGATESQKLDAKIGRYYGLRSAISAMSNFIVRHKGLQGILMKQSVYDQTSVDLGLLPRTGLPILTEWFKTKGSGIERMHMSIDGSKFTADLRFGARYSQMYNFDGEFNFNRNVFSAMNQLIARFMSRTFDANQEKMYKGVVGAFDKVFSYEINNPFANAWPDIWPAVYLDKTEVPKAVVTEKDSFNVIGDIASFDTVVAGGVGVVPRKNALGSPSALTNYITALGISAGAYPNGQAQVGQLRQRNLPDSDGLLLASLAHIIQNIKSNKDSAGGLLNIAESWSDISQATKDTLREELPLFKKYFNELGVRARYLKDLNDNFATSTNIPANNAIIYPKNIRAPTEMSVPYLNRLLSKVVDISEAFEKTVDDMIKEIGVPTEYGELFPGFLKAYQSKFGTVPLVLPSMIFSHVFNRSSIDADGKNTQFIPATKGTSERYLTAFINNIGNVTNSPIIDMLIKNFDGTVNGPERLIKSDIVNAVGGYTQLVEYLGYCRQYKSFFVLPMAYNATIMASVNDFDKLIYPESYNATARSYTKTPANISVRTPWTIGLFVDESAKKNPGITMNLVNTVGIRYLNSYFIEQRGVTYLNNITTALIAEKMKVIFDHFRITSVSVGNANTDTFVVKNILDMNIVPIDFSGFNRFIPYSNIMNYAYTLEQLALDMLVPHKLEKAAIEKSMISTNTIPIVSAETLMYSMIVNPFVKFRTDSRQWNQLINMFRGNNAIDLGRPIFLDDQVFQKLLFGSNVSRREAYNPSGHENVGFGDLNDSIADSTATKTRFDMPVYRGSGESSDQLRKLFGMDKLREHAGSIVTALATILNGATAKFTVNNFTNDANPTDILFEINSKGVVGTGRYYLPGRIYNNDLADLQINVVQDLTNAKDYIHMKNTSGVDVCIIEVDAGIVILPLTVNRFAPGWGKALTVPLVDNVFGKAPKLIRNISTSLTTFNMFLSAVAESVKYDIIKFIQQSGLRPSAKFDLAVEADKIVADLLNNNNRNPLANVPVEVSSDPRSIIDNLGDMGALNANVDNLALACYLVSDVGSVDNAYTIARSLPFGAAPSNLRGPALVSYMSGVLSKLSHKPRILGQSSSNSIITATTNNTKTHKITGYFKSEPGFVPSFPGQLVNTANVFNIRPGELNYIDPQKMGVSRVRTVQTARTNSELSIIGSMRMNTVMVKLIIFLNNAYRLILYRLREDSKNKHARTAKGAEELLDDSNTEFTGFDMFE